MTRKPLADTQEINSDAVQNLWAVSDQPLNVSLALHSVFDVSDLLKQSPVRFGYLVSDGGIPSVVTIGSV